MKSKITLSILILLSFYFCNAQNPDNTAGGGEFVFNADKTPCLTDVQREEVLADVKNGIQQLKLQKRLAFSEVNKGGGHPLFIWPLQKANGLNYNEIYGISGYVDHNLNFNNNLLDYNCGSTTYDSSNYNHQGVDMFTWPFGWKMMDNDEVEIIAAAAGQILVKIDGEFDRSCDFNDNIWNAIYVQHSDGSVVLYGHMKNGSTTTKNVGDMVAEGEYLGVVGSSGNSTGPHLHFEVYSEIEWNGVGQDVLVDPYTGACNSMNGDSWWQTQRPYINPGINAVLTHTAAPVFPTCPTTETTNESNQFDLIQEVIFTLFLKDQVAGTSVNLRIIRPDNTDLFNWNFDLTNNQVASWYSWNTFPNVVGEWKWQATYAGETVTHTFNVGTLGVDENDFSKTSVYPNPFNDVVNINSTTKIKKASVIDMLGKTVLVFNENSEEGIKELNLSQFSNGMYFVTLEGEQNQKKTIKLIKK